MKVPRLNRTPVEWVDLYTRQSLMAMFWLNVGVLLLGATPIGAKNAPAMAALVLIALVMIGVGTWALRAVCSAWPDGQATPAKPVLTMCVASAACAGLSMVLPTDPQHAGLAMVWAAMSWSLTGLRDRRHLGLLLVVMTAAAAVTTRSVPVTLVALGGALFLGFTVHISLWLLELVRRLDQSRDTEAALAVAEERLRFSRDVHDVLGRHLSTIAVRAELAAALARRGDPSAAETMLEVRATAHDALREARELARGYRATDLDQELRGARSLLAAAGISTVTEVDDLPFRWHEPAAWVVREAVTNVLRHSTATEVEIGWRDGVLSVSNNGAASPTPEQRSSSGVGLLGLTERLAPLGSVVSTSMRGDRWTLAVTMPVADTADGKTLARA
ncbi:sensor histidine kinase [Nocardioides sp.]|uniref:sensor histidine kinase n=1 Tax=Nocardioides sp. TaxID=35761 RepID=UPI002B7C6A6F|nr:histidine kinase [Nocardioides sp.]HXH81087.1 histidine kinase [Nocardioides sp.]